MCGIYKSFKNIRKALEWGVKDLNFNGFCTVGPGGHVSTVAFFKKKKLKINKALS